MPVPMYSKRAYAQYSEQEKEIIRQYYEPTKAKASIKVIQQYLPHRSYKAILHQARVLNLSRHRSDIEWSQEELKVLHDLAETKPVSHVLACINRIRTMQCKHPRTRSAVARMMRKLSYSTLIDGEYYNIQQISDAIGATRQVVNRWLKEKSYVNVLKPQKEGNQTLISIDNLRKFFRKYPGEIGKFRVDIVWLISVLS